MFRALLSCIVLLFAFPVAAQPMAAPLPFDSFTLGNGLHVIVHTDRKAPIVAVAVWYHVGSANEPDGKEGFAHLFEHIMFNGSENAPGQWFTAMEATGAIDVNGSTGFDETRYYQTVPREALERLLWLESDRMGHLVGALTQTKLDTQRAVVLNEKRQVENQPYGTLDRRMLAALVPPEHPYSHPTIGNVDDLNAATLDTAKQWFRDYYGPNNAVLVLAGDIDLAAARPLVERWFGDIRPGPNQSAFTSWVPRRSVNSTELVEEDAPAPRVVRRWMTPGYAAPDRAALSLLAEILGGAERSRLHQRLAGDAGLATSAAAYVQPRGLMSFFSVDVTAQRSADLPKIRTALDDELANLGTKLVGAQELARAKAQVSADLLKRLEKLGGYTGKTTELAQGALYAGQPDFVSDYFARIQTVTAKEIRDTARRWLQIGSHEITVMPVPRLSRSAQKADRSQPPALGATAPLAFPATEEAVLENGLRLVVARRAGDALIAAGLQMQGGTAADSVGTAKPGLNAFVLGLLREDPRLEKLDALGSSFDSTASADTSILSLTALRQNLGPSLSVVGDLLAQPQRSATSLESQRKRQLADIEQEKSIPAGLGMRLIPGEVFGAKHPYGGTLNGTGTTDGVKAISADDVAAFRAAWFRPDRATLFLVGDIGLAEALPLVRKAMKVWRGTGEPPASIAFPESPPRSARIVLIDRPGAEQTMLYGGQAAPSSREANEAAIDTANDIIGGMVSARVNEELREKRGWTYGAFTRLNNAAGPRLFMAMSPVQTDKTAQALKTFQDLLTAYVGLQPATSKEFENARRNNVQALPGQFETGEAVLRSLMSSARFGRSYDYPVRLQRDYEALTLDQVREAARFIRPETMTWLVIGDLARIEQPIRALNLAPVEVLGGLAER